MKKISKITILISLIIIVKNITMSAEEINPKTFENLGYFLPLDKNGWTIYKPSINSRMIYVSTTEGNYKTAQLYLLTSKEVGKNPFLPQGKIKAFKSIKAALKEARDHAPDWILLKRGDVWHENLKELKNGESKHAPSLFSSYGQDIQRPVLKTDTIIGFKIPQNLQFAVLSGIHFQAINKDEIINKNTGVDGIQLVNKKGEKIESFLIEDCIIQYYKHNLTLLNSGTMKNFVIRRNLILDAYTSPKKKEKKAISQGILATGANFLLEENIFDHNGWKIQRHPNHDWIDPRAGQATWLNHNAYFPNAQGVIIRKNIFLRSSSIQNKWTANNGTGSARDVIIDNNFYMDGEIGISMGGNKNGPLRFVNIKIINNVLEA